MNKNKAQMTFIEEFDLAIALFSHGDIPKAVFTKSNSEVFEFTETLAILTSHHYQPNRSQNENFSFIANSSLSGGNHPCSASECRSNKLAQLVSFSSLYSDEVYIQNPFESLAFKEPDDFGEKIRLELLYAIDNYFYLKPLLKAGIIKYARNMVSLCSHHWETLGKPLAEKIEKKEKELFNIIQDHLLDKCNFTFDINQKGTFFEITGPDSFVNHGKSYIHFYDQLPDFLQEISKKNLPYKFSETEVIDYELMELIINPMLRDLSDQEWHSAFYGTSYLCDSSMQLKLASQLNNNIFALNSNAFEKGMKHSLPTVFSHDVTTILNLRERENEAFQVYRDKLNTMIRQSKNWNESEVTAIFRDQVLPEINLIEKKIKNWKSKSRESLKEKIIFGSGAVTMGLYSGILPPDIAQITAALGGSSAIVGAIMDFNKSLKTKQEASSSDFYFLWEANQKH